MTISNKLSKILRKNSTEPEKILWHRLRNRRFGGYKFRRQFTIGKYIVDFICLEEKLVIELDGSEHLEPDALEYDKNRTAYLNKHGFKIIRFYNNDVFNNLDKVLECLRQELIPPSSGFQPPSPIKGEGAVNQDTFTPKQQLRKWARDKRLELNLESISHVLVQKLKETKEYKNSKNIMIFYPLKGEVNLLSLMEDNTKTFYLPKIDGENLLCCKFNKNTELCESCFHTMEPILPPSSGFQQPSPLKGEGLENDSLNQDTFSPPDLVIVPALAVDKNNYRLGYGKGFYDRFLSGLNPPVKTIVCIPHELVVENIFPNEYDIPVDIVITA